MVVLSYLSNSAILHYLPIDKRQELSKKVPTFRVANRNIPYRLNRVYIHIRSEYNTLSLGNCNIKYDCVKGEIKKSTLTNPSFNRYDIEWLNGEAYRREVSPENIEIRNNLLKKLIRYFLNRPGTSVDYLSIENKEDIKWCKQDDFNDIQLKISVLHAENQKNNMECAIELLKCSQFSLMDLKINELEDIDMIKSFKGSPNANYVIQCNNSEIDLQLILNKLHDKMKYTLKLGENLSKNFLETLKTSRSYPLGLTVHLFHPKPESQLKEMGGVESFLTKDCKIQCYTFPTSDPEKEVIVSWENFFKAEVQKSGTSVPCTLVPPLPVKRIFTSTAV